MCSVLNYGANANLVMIIKVHSKCFVTDLIPPLCHPQASKSSQDTGESRIWRDRTVTQEQSWTYCISALLLVANASLLYCKMV